MVVRRGDWLLLALVLRNLLAAGWLEIGNTIDKFTLFGACRCVFGGRNGVCCLEDE